MFGLGGSRLDCFGCKQGIKGGTEYVTIRNKVFHPHCFRCAGCQGVIPHHTPFSSKPGEEDQFYHTPCYQQLFAPECCVCHEKMLPNHNGMIEYAVTPFWNQKFCRRHSTDGTSKCFACQRMESVRERHVVLSESPRAAGVASASNRRALCLSCAESVVGSSDDVAVIYREMVSFFGSLGARLPLDMPVHLVETSALNATHSHRRSNGHNCLGMTMSEERTTVRHHTMFESEVIARRSNVTAVLVLYGLPRMLFSSVLAHECTHAYIKLNDFPKLTLQTEEGLCQLLAYLWLKAQPPGEGDKEKEKLYHMTKIFEDESVVYGDGFRMSFEAYTKYGLNRVLSHVKLSGALPL
ncbi:LIM zinc-binding domain-containing protein [Chloropicon primus]|uniref:LIM zinc-binding domain-containing protein n=1 Tax=Chloropicon primus TaxID=1764295 RepID=A0A5B8MNL8_9CHLO|nr:hypothetical protein A3770_06p45970 [Chloropicon primus]UPR01298.1 LIM zinc-binding domain-containing protein [Chloropicon primus]|mmetsp:Transcript_1907/g.5195  ORF Transcript_1907/g.5195 Transcript_1907/m.5195 type:complete len:352 (+) Transcript_1907:110-1165(+)|eukprot:QDZ22079.1 hypothetical protein A3770_06p45970 [Chloropicon primus]